MAYPVRGQCAFAGGSSQLVGNNATSPTFIILTGPFYSQYTINHGTRHETRNRIDLSTRTSQFTNHKSFIQFLLLPSHVSCSLEKNCLFILFVYYLLLLLLHFLLSPFHVLFLNILTFFAFFSFFILYCLFIYLFYTCLAITQLQEHFGFEKKKRKAAKIRIPPSARHRFSSFRFSAE